MLVLPRRGARSFEIFVFIVVASFSTARSLGDVTLFSRHIVGVPSPEGRTGTVDVLVPSSPGELRLARPADVYATVVAAYDAVVATQQSGLVDAKSPHLADIPLSPAESWHHHQASLHGAVDSARFLITFSLVPAIQTGGGPLHIAAARGATEQVAALLARGADPNAAREDTGHTPLHFAAAMGHAEVVELLLRSGADVERTGRDGATALMIASSFGHAAVVSVLLTTGRARVTVPHAFAGTTALHFAAEVGRVAVIELLCAADPRAGEARTTSGGQALHTAADANQSAVIGPLVHQCGADPNALLAGDTPPVYLAAQRGLDVVIHALAAVGADLGLPMPQLPFRGALVPASAEARSGADTAPPREGDFYGPKNTKAANGATALHAAAEHGHLAAVEALLAHGAPQTTSMQGASPLLIALQYGFPKIALALLRSAGDPAIDAATRHDGAFPLLVAVERGYADVVRALLERGAKPDQRDARGRTPLSVALSTGNAKIVRYLRRVLPLEAQVA